VLTITAANDLRIRIPAALNMTWDTSVTTVSVSGSASGRVSTTLLAYEDGNRTLVLDVTSTFNYDDTLTISGARFANFTAISPASFLELVVLGSGAATTDADNRSKTIVGAKLYFHDVATPDTGTLPGATTLSATTPNVTAATAGTNRDMDQTIGTAQASSALTTLAQTGLQKNWFRRFLSRPLAAQTLPTGTWSIQGGASESSTNSNVLPWGAVLSVWRPSTGAVVATLLDNTTLGSVEPGTTETNISSTTGSISGIAVSAGDVLVLELWAQNTQGNATARTNTIYYDGTTEGSTASNAAFLQAPGGISFSAAPTFAGFKISYSNFGLFCLAQTMTITVVDGSGNPVSGYTGTMNLSTTTGRGTWSKTAGNGTLTDTVPDDGAASYAWNAADTTATFSLSYRTGAAVVTVNAVDSLVSSTRDDGTQGAITFSPSGFTVTSAPFSNPAGGVPAFASPETAGTAFNVYLTAYGQNPTDATCGIITGYTGAKSLKFWASYVNPASGTLVPTINGSAIASAEGSASAQSVTFASGQATVAAIYKDAGSLSIAMKDDTTGNPSLPTGIRGSTGSFVSIPANFVVTNIQRASDGLANPAAGSASGAVFIGAGQLFKATVTAVESGGATTPNFGRESSPESVKFSATLVLPASGNNPAVSGTAGTFSSGVATGTSFAWPEVGIVTLVPRIADGDYLGAGDVVGSATGNVGRFVPNGFGVSLNTPVFATACLAGSYTYVGQPFVYTVAPVITLTAQALGGSTTLNYTGSLMRLSNSSLTGRSYTPTPASPALDTSGLPASGVDPAIVDLGGGLATLTFSAGTGLSYSHGSPVAPFNANIALAINVIDLDGVSASNPVAFGGGTGIAFNSGASQRYGRLVLRNRVGSELLDLPLALRTEYYLGSTQGFTQNLADSCSTAPTLAASNYLSHLSAGQTCVRDSGSPGVSGLGCAAPAGSGRYRAVAVGGDFNLTLAAPGAGHDGALTLTANAPSWLKYTWDASSGTPGNPSAVATFGEFPGSTTRVYQREIY
jgi:hypothetical protein